MYYFTFILWRTTLKTYYITVVTQLEAVGICCNKFKGSISVMVSPLG